MPISWWMDEESLLHPLNGMLVSNKRERSTDTQKQGWTSKTLHQNKRSQMKKTTDFILYDSSFMNCLEKANPERQKADEWLPGAEGGNREWLQMGRRGLFGAWKCLQIGSGWLLDNSRNTLEIKSSNNILTVSQLCHTPNSKRLLFQLWIKLWSHCYKMKCLPWQYVVQYYINHHVLSTWE